MAKTRMKYGTQMVAIAALCLLSPLMARPAYAVCAAPAGTAGDIVYNTTENVFQYCNDTDWVGMHVPGAGAGGCTNPAYSEGQLVYSSEHRMLQGCAGAQWKGIGKPPAKSWAAPPALAHSLAGTQAAGMFGRSVAISGNLVALAVPAMTVGGFAGAGQAYVYHAETGALVSTLVNPDLTASDRMGRTGLGISGELVVVGAFDDDPGGLSSAGSAYVYNAITGALVSTLNAPIPEAGDVFGTSAAIDGNLVVVGATQGGPGNVGEAYIYNATTGALVSTLVNPNPTANDNFGVNVSISGNLAVVGANFDDPGGINGSGSAYVFNATTGALLTTLVNPGPTISDRFGEGVAIDGNLVLVVALFDDPGGNTDVGAAYVFNASTGALISTLNNPDPTTNDEFSRGLIGLSGGLAILASQNDDPGGVTDAGTAYVFNAMTGALLATLNNPDPTTTDSFGYSVGISGDKAVVGAYQDDPGGVGGAGSVYIFQATYPAEANCTNPAGTPGSIFYTSQHNVLEYCNGARWSAVGLYPYNCDGTQPIGAVCKGGLVYAGLSPDGNVPMYTTQYDAGQLPWNNGTGTYTTTSIADQDDGEANTAALVALAAGDFPYMAAGLCDALTASGYSDWYLPSENELAVLYANRAAIGGFVPNQYWSSTESANHAAVIYTFDGSGWNAATKNGFLYIRCVRK